MIYSLEEAAARMAAQRAAKPPEPVTFNCAVCGFSSPHSEPHRCTFRTNRDRRRVRAQFRLNRIQAARERVRPCEICHEYVSSHARHECPGPGDKALQQAKDAMADANAFSVVSMLRRAGYTVTKDN